MEQSSLLSWKLLTHLPRQLNGLQLIHALSINWRHKELLLFQNKNKDEVPNDLLLLADPDQENINRYIDSTRFICAKLNDDVVGVVGRKEINENKIEIMMLAVYEEFQNKGIGVKLIEKSIEEARISNYKEVVIKTGNSSLKQISLYQKCGFRLHSIRKDYFRDNYKHPIFENGLQCLDQVELRYRLYNEEEIEKEVSDYWKRFIDKNSEYKNNEYEIWSFGYGEYQANKLLGLAKQGIKTGTTSAYEMYEENDKISEQNDISIVTYGNGLPGCIIKTTEVRKKSFNEITADEARLESEGDKTLEYWRRVHKEFFRKEYEEAGKRFNENIPVIYEIFNVIYDADVKL